MLHAHRKAPLSNRRRGFYAVLLVVGALMVACAAWLGTRSRPGAPPCPNGTVLLHTRCCAPGQQLINGNCIGPPTSCPKGWSLVVGGVVSSGNSGKGVDGVVSARSGDSTGLHGCVAPTARIGVAATRLFMGPGDWEAQGVVTPREVVIASPFTIDSIEVTVARWNQCVLVGACPALSAAHVQEPGQPVRWVTLHQAVQFCAHHGGSLPTVDQWLAAAATKQSNRYPWGDSGATCARADWGRHQGPCTTGATGPQWAGLFEGDRTHSGIIGLAAGLSEWTIAADGTAMVQAGSWKSHLAAQIRTWKSEHRPSQTGYDDVGFRCVYELDTP